MSRQRLAADACLQRILQILNTSSISRLVLSGSCTGVDQLSVVVDNALDQTLLLEMSDGTSGERSVDLHSVDQGRLGDDSVGRDLLDDFVAVV